MRIPPSRLGSKVGRIISRGRRGERDVGRDQPTGTASYGYGSYIREGGTSISIVAGLSSFNKKKRLGYPGEIKAR